MFKHSQDSDAVRDLSEAQKQASVNSFRTDKNKHKVGETLEERQEAFRTKKANTSDHNKSTYHSSMAGFRLQELRRLIEYMKPDRFEDCVSVKKNTQEAAALKIINETQNAELSTLASSFKEKGVKFNMEFHSSGTFPRRKVVYKKDKVFFHFKNSDLEEKNRERLVRKFVLLAKFAKNANEIRELRKNVKDKAINREQYVEKRLELRLSKQPYLSDKGKKRCRKSYGEQFDRLEKLKP